jgi:nitronate monooxygenase
MADLKTYLTWTQTPLIINAPMAAFAGGSLASSVSIAGGFGLIGGTPDMIDLRKQLQIASEAFKSDPSAISSSETLPVGVGLLPFITKVETTLQLLQEFKPTVVWLFAAKEFDDYAEWARKIREASPKSKIWIQCGTVASALYIAKVAKPDALCMQGSDHGGHGFEGAASIVTLVPEAKDTLAREGFGDIPILASGGIVDGRGVAAALALGASGVVIGTRFLASKEVIVHPHHQAAVLQASDGGQITAKSKLFDELKGPNIWPTPYDGRSLAVQSWKDHKNGVHIDEIRKKHNEATEKEDKGYAKDLSGRAAMWAGTGVGLVNEVKSAGDIVEAVREGARKVLRELNPKI